MGRDIGSHTDSNTAGTVDEQIRDLGRHDSRFLQGIIEVVHHVDRLLVQVVHHGLSHQLQSGFRITHGSSAVTVYRTEVTLSVHQSITHAPFLSHTHQRTVNRGITMRMILTEHFTDNTRAFLVRFVMGITQFFHSKQDTPVYRFKSVSYVRKRTCHNNRHRIVDVRIAHFILYVYFNNSVLIQHYAYIIVLS